LKNLPPRILQRQRTIALEMIETLTLYVIDQGHPADRVLSKFFRNHHEFGSRDRRFFSEVFFATFRWRGWVEPLGLATGPCAALCWLLENDELYPALATDAAKVWEPLGGRPLAEKRAALAQWFSRSFTNEALVPPFFNDEVEADEAFFETLQQRPPAWIRTRHPELAASLSKAGIALREHPVLSGALAISAGVSLQPFGKGRFEVQDLASQAVGAACAPQPGEEWWDACAGAGGKALHLADLMERQGKVLATDIRSTALSECKRRARADGLPIVRIQLHDLEQGEPFSHQFDGVLVDAPCSGWGTWSRNPDARWRSDARDPAQKRNRQLRMLFNAAACVKAGGVLVYAVCTFTQAETVEVIEGFLGTRDDFELEGFPHPLTGEPTGGALQILPPDGPCDGMFIARFRRNTL